MIAVLIWSDLPVRVRHDVDGQATARCRRLRSPLRPRQRRSTRRDLRPAVQPHLPTIVRRRLRPQFHRGHLAEDLAADGALLVVVQTFRHAPQLPAEVSRYANHTGPGAIH